jgi:CDGSH-type Zn-finger protein/uncharacterized Fe-S cluster protein YjdI
VDESRDPGPEAPDAPADANAIHGEVRGDRVHAFTAPGIRVTWSRMRCTHVAACVMNLPKVFEPGRRPWVDLGQGSADAIARTVQRCPTGALHFERTDGGESEPVPTVNTAVATRNGPFAVRGDIEVRDASGTLLLRDTRVALCRCGRSANRPFCDNSHVEAAFRDDGALHSESGVQETGAEGPRVQVQPEADGALVLTGPFALASADGATMLAGTRARLCRCGQSATKPFCDESHVRTGFRSR